MHRIIIDSSVYLSIYLQDSNYDKAKRLLDNYFHDTTCKIFIPTVIIAEVLNVLFKKNKDIILIKNFIAEIVSSSRFKVINPDLLFYFKKIRKYSAAALLKTSDLVIYCIARSYKIDTIISLDKKLYEKTQPKST